MSVYINGMEMPKNCGHCPLNKLNTEYGGLVYECIITGHYLDDGYEGTIMSNCPIVPVPDHSDLIERDTLPWYLKDVTEILEAPTIIPADRKEERIVKWREWNTFEPLRPADKEDG